MNDSLNMFAEDGSLESLIRSARDYVRPSDDLRPRVLENARADCFKRQATRHLWQAAALVLFSGSVAAAFFQSLELTAAASYPTVTAAGQLVVPGAAAARTNDASWQMVESFTQLRVQQARLLRM
jgi:hypothetical protein